jgi:ATP-dependent DNA ligase
VIVKKTAPEYRPGVDPPCPSVAVDGEVVALDDTVTFEELAAALRRAGA